MARKVLIVGAGASGLMAAVTAARAGAQVTVLEAMERPGRKLLLTGNGRCNLTNMDPELSTRYYGSGRELARSLTGRFGAGETRQFFEELGLLTVEKNGYVYPYNMQSSAVLDVLLTELRRLRVKLKLNERVEHIWREREPSAQAECAMAQGGAAEPLAVQEKDRQDSGRETALWRVQTASWRYTADALILACGSKCMPQTGSDGSGYHIAAQLGHTMIQPRPALTPLICEGDFLPSVAGVRCRAAVSLYRNGRFLKKETGELQWTKYGISGIAVFQLSRFVGTDGTWLSVDLLPEYEPEYLTNLLRQRARELPQENVSALLGGMLNNKLIPVILERTEQPEKSCTENREESGSRNKGKNSRRRTGLLCKELTDHRIRAIVDQIKDFRLHVTGTKDYDFCQVCRGGVDCSEVSAETLESRLHPGLYFTGELLDVDGPCGGYNLQWAWTSGAAAGNAASFPLCEKDGMADSRNIWEKFS